eukprot:1372074-Amorphochlora_amoeboformis.AAC.3
MSRHDEQCDISALSQLSGVIGPCITLPNQRPVQRRALVSRLLPSATQLFSKFSVQKGNINWKEVQRGTGERRIELGGSWMVEQGDRAWRSLILLFCVFLRRIYCIPSGNSISYEYIRRPDPYFIELSSRGPRERKKKRTECRVRGGKQNEENRDAAEE